MKVLIVGGAGYIGAITSKLFEEAGHEVIVFDDLSTGFEKNVSSKLIRGSVTDAVRVEELFDAKFDAVLHFAAKLEVGESVTKPKLYFENNVQGSLNLIDAAAQSGCKHFIFSSSATVYGDPDQVPIPETAAIRPINPYGFSKVMVEEMLASYHITSNLEWVAFRYFNPVGAYKGIGPSPLVSNLMPAALKALSGEIQLQVFGDDYDTPDGTCIRDYVYVVEIARAHVMAAEQMTAGKAINQAINLGSGNGYSVLKLIKTLEDVAERPVPHKIVGRRAGDSPKSVASNMLAKELLGWQPKADLTTMVKSAYDWYTTQSS